MKLSAAAVVFTLATLVAGSPIAVSTKTASTNSVDGSIEKRSSTTGGLYACTNDNFGGHCEHLSMTFDKCYDFSADLAHQVSSIGPDRGTSCNLYPAKRCTGPTMIGGVSTMNNAQYPGYPILKNIGLDNFFAHKEFVGVGDDELLVGQVDAGDG